MALLTKERARKIIDEIRVNNGGLTAEDRRNTPENVLQVLENVLRQLGSSTRALARDLYTSESRFVYELIQNAEDNSYSCANNGDPYIRFTLTPEKIIVENNELGFNEADVRSICKVGDSTKINRIGFIGEKGIGFKSVFQVAQKVRIQSSSFDFYFEHLPSGTGMGMITPVNEEEDPEFYEDGTRMTLKLLRPDDFSKRSTDLLGIPDALILFLPKLQRIEILIQRQNGDLSRTVHESHNDGQNSRLVKRVDDSVSEKFFHVERRKFQGLPSDDARTNRDRAEVVLAFPITNDSRPIVEPQLTFSFLPIRKFGFKVCSMFFT
jgi:anti-sigma regulatory factor (Ser/Thr protein kinase)